MRAYRFPLALVVAALAAACSPADHAPTAPDAAALDAKPPAYASTCKLVVRFDPPPVGTVFGAPVGQPPGTVAFIESGVAVRTATFDTGGGIFYNHARIENAPAAIAFGDGHVARMNNMNFRYTPPAGSGPYYSVVFEFMDLGGVENLSVNGHPTYVGNLAALPNPYFVWSTSVTTSPIPGGVEGVVRISGTTPITDLVIGGQEEWVDNVCFR